MQEIALLTNTMRRLGLGPVPSKSIRKWTGWRLTATVRVLTRPALRSCKITLTGGKLDIETNILIMTRTSGT